MKNLLTRSDSIVVENFRVSTLHAGETEVSLYHHAEVTGFGSDERTCILRSSKQML